MKKYIQVAVWSLEFCLRALLSLLFALVGFILIFLGFRRIGIKIHNLGISLMVDATLIGRDHLSINDKDKKDFEDMAEGLDELFRD